MRRLLIVGYGDIGKRFAARYASQFSLTAVCRTKINDSSSSIRSVNWLNADLDTPQTLRRLPDYQTMWCILHLQIRMDPQINEFVTF